MSTKAKHTPTPWSMALRIKQRNETVDSYFFGPKKSSEQWLGDVSGKTNAEAAANAEFIVLACNAHEDLVKACEAAIEATGGSAIWNGETKRFLEMCEAALAKVRGEQ